MFTGLYTALVTPFLPDGRLNEAKLRELVSFQAINGVTGVVPGGTTGENPTFSDKEHLRVIQITVEAAREVNLKVIAGCGSNNTEKAAILCKKAAELGADGALVITPYYNKPNQEGLYKHFMAVADNSPIPVVMYNVPGRTCVNLLPEPVERLATHENIVGLKEASASVAQVQEIIFAAGDRLNIFSGEDELTYAIMAIGGKGVISVASNIIPEQMNNLVQSMLKNDFATGLRIAKEINEICKKMFIDTNPIPVKEAMNLMGMSVGPTRLPLTAISDANRKILITLLKKNGLLIND